MCLILHDLGKHYFFFLFVCLKVFQGDKVGTELTPFQQVKEGSKGGKTGAAVVGITCLWDPKLSSELVQ